MAPPSERRPRGRPRSLEPGDANAQTVQALDRGVRLLQILARDGRATLTDLALSAGMPASTAHRLLTTLQARSMVAFAEPTQEWAIGVEAFRIGSAFEQRRSLAEAGREAMDRLVEETGETANIAIMDEGEVVFLAQADTQNPIRAFFRAGSRVPMHASGIGKALLAQMDRAAVARVLGHGGLAGFTPKTLTAPAALEADLAATRARGWALDDEERHDGMRCIAAPVFNAHGAPIAGISISGPTARLGDGAIAGLGARVRRAADKVTELSGGHLPGHGR